MKTNPAMDLPPFVKKKVWEFGLFSTENGQNQRIWNFDGSGLQCDLSKISHEMRQQTWQTSSEMWFLLAHHFGQHLYWNKSVNRIEDDLMKRKGEEPRNGMVPYGTRISTGPNDTEP